MHVAGIQIFTWLHKSNWKQSLWV